MKYATYSPDDNKLRIYTTARLPQDEYEKVRAAGFRWAPKQELWVAPMWTPDREDVAIELCGEVGDEDTSLVERAEERAERFEDYHDARMRDYEGASKAVAAIADNIPFGQPILVGHHSEKRARKDAERIQNGMRAAVKAFDTAQYWTERAAGALAHAKYKERPDVRQRRIKKLEAELRKILKKVRENAASIAAWEAVNDHATAYFLAGRGWYNVIDREGMSGAWTAYDVLRPDGERFAACPAMAWEDVKAAVIKRLSRYNPKRWIDHYEGRLAYERAMLAEAGGGAADKWNFEVGGRVLRKGSWYVIVRVNPASVTVSGHFTTTVPHDEIAGYEPPSAEAAAKVAAAMKLPPLCNYPGEGFRHMTKAELQAEPCRRWSDFPKIGYIKANDKHGRHRIQQTREGQWGTVGVFVTDAKRKDPPPPPAPDAPKIQAPERAAPQPVYKPREQDQTVEAMREVAKNGVQTIVANQLFPTPPELAARMVELAEIEPGMCVLEPSAGTGNIVRAVVDAVDTEILGYEISQQLCAHLDRTFPSYRLKTVCKDFLEVEDFLGCYPRVLMNPPFENAADVKHILHARRFLAPGGKLVAICAGGPRQEAALRPLAATWEPLPAGTFAEAGTNVKTVLLTMEA